MSNETGVPPAAQLLRDFINTREPQAGRDALTSAEELRDWFADRGLVPNDAELRPSDVAVAVTVREGLRTVLLGHIGQLGDTKALDTLNNALAELPVRLMFSEDGYHLVSTLSSPLGQALGRLADAIRQCTEDGAWPRLKVCARETCRWTFYDASRNQVRRWCSMAGCGNHIKMQRAYAARKIRQRQPANGPVQTLGRSAANQS
jgi:predicted RNA-binding Zn ribbon-like protein